MKRTLRLTALFIAATLLLGSVQAADTILPAQWHGAETMEELLRYDYDDTERIYTLCEEIRSGTETLQSGELEELLSELRSAYLLLDTGLTIAELRSDQNVNDAEANQVYLRRLNQLYEVEEAMTDTVQAVLNSPNAGLIDQEDPVFSMFLWPSEGLTDEEWEIYAEEQALVDDYFEIAAQTFTVTLSGTSYTETQLADAFYSGTITGEEYDNGLLEISKAENDALAQIYVDLVRNRNTQAAWYGISDYAKLQDEYIFIRDYTAREIRHFSELVKRYAAPLYHELDGLVDELYEQGSYDTVFSEEELFQSLRDGVTSVSEELLPALDYMEEKGLYDIAWSPDKMDGAYTTILPVTAAPFLLFEPTETNRDFTDLVHEFGHYNAYFCSEDFYASNLDLSEIHSQALELLMMDDYEQVFGKDAQAERIFTLYNMLGSLVDGCMMNELERYAYQEKDLTVDKLNKTYMELLRDYGYRTEDDPEENAYGWVLVSHLYSQPLYYISYAVSASAALELWTRSLESREDAVETYLKLVALGETGDFFETLEQVGLADPLTEDALVNMTDAVRGQTELSRTEEPSKNDLAKKGIILAVSILIVAAAQGTVTLVDRKRRRSP